MNQAPILKSSILAIRSSIRSWIAERSFLLVALTLAWFAFSQPVQGQDGDELNHNTAEGAFSLHTYIATASGAFNNTAIGFNTLYSDTTGGNNTANGFDALFSNTTGSFNTATGYGALISNTTANYNTATGFQALFNNTTGTYNTAMGINALFGNTTGVYNTASGVQALQNNTTGNANTANGLNALYHNTTAGNNSADGFDALFRNTTGNNNTADGFQALFNNTSGGSNIALGFQAGFNLTTGSSNIDIGNVGGVGESNTIRIGTVGTQTVAFIAGIHGIGVTGSAVVVNSSGQLGVAPSSERFKEAIKPLDKASEAILALKPVTFRYKKDLDPDGIPQFGLVAEQVEKVDPDLVARDADGKVYTVRYEAVNAMLLNEFLKEHRKVEQQNHKIQEQDAIIAREQRDFQAAIARQQMQIESLAAAVQNVSAQLELSKPAPQVIADSR